MGFSLGSSSASEVCAKNNPARLYVSIIDNIGDNPERRGRCFVSWAFGRFRYPLALGQFGYPGSEFDPCPANYLTPDLGVNKDASRPDNFGPCQHYACLVAFR